jgi:DNA replication protein DnaC
LIRHGVFFGRCAELYAALRESYRLGESEDSVLRPYFSKRFLILDDLGAGSLSDHERRSTLEVLDRRLNAQLPTVLTTNWNIKEISERMDDRIASRLSSLTLLVLSGEDWRLSLSSTAELAGVNA